MNSFVKRKYTFTKGDERIEFESATDARKHFFMATMDFPSQYIKKGWNGWTIEGGPWKRGETVSGRMKNGH